MEPITIVILKTFLQRLGERYPGPATLYLLGGSALCLLGNPRTTVDVDYTFDIDPQDAPLFQSTLAELATEMRLDIDDVPLAEFIPLPPGAYERRRYVGRFGRLQVYVFDPYSIALSKIARGFEADLEDVVFMWRNRLIEFDELERHFQVVLPLAATTDIIPQEFQEYFKEIRRRLTDDLPRHE